MDTREITRTAYEIVVGVARTVATLIASPLLRSHYNRWGATDDEVHDPMPGDDLVNAPMLGYTRAITIQAPPAEVWPWLAQFGQGKGGFYSYDALENLVGCRIHSTDTILPEYQDLRPGELIRSGPGDRYAAWEVLRVDPPRSLVLMGADAATGKAPDPVDEIPEKGYAASTWQWSLAPVDGGAATRLVVRQRLAHSPGQRLLWRLVEPLNFVMESEMLRGIKRRAEAGGRMRLPGADREETP